MRTNLGRVSPLPRGAWTDSVSYSKGDIVRSKDAAYIALQESSNVEPGVSAMWTRHWKLIASDGNHADLELLSKSLSLANEVIGMEATAQSVPYGSPIAVFSSADPTQNSLSLHFQIPKNSEFVFPPEVASMYSYNGTVLPALPEWDKETYPYAVITSLNDSSHSLVCFSAPVYYHDGYLSNYFRSKDVCSSIGFYYEEPYHYEWTSTTNYEKTDIAAGENIVTARTPIWANFEVLNEDNTVKLTASEPVPVQLVGYSYNGTVLPKLPEWDKTAYPYAFISNYIFDSVIFHALAQEPYNNGIAPNEGTICNPYDESIPFVQSFLSEDGNSWDELTTGSLGPSGQISEPFWSNFDVKYENGSVQLSASEPVPVYEPIQNSSS